MMMRVETTFRLWGYPGLAILLFLAAAGAVVILLVNILFYDKSDKGYAALSGLQRKISRQGRTIGGTSSSVSPVSIPCCRRLCRTL